MPTLQAALNLLVGPSVTKSFTTHAEIENHGIWTKLAARFDRFWGSKEAGLPVRESCLKRRAARQNQSQRSQACRTDCFFRLAARRKQEDWSATSHPWLLFPLRFIHSTRLSVRQSGYTRIFASVLTARRFLALAEILLSVVFLKFFKPPRIGHLGLKIPQFVQQRDRHFPQDFPRRADTLQLPLLRGLSSLRKGLIYP